MKIPKLDETRRSGRKLLDDLLGEQNRLSKQIGQLMGQGKKDEAEALKSQVAALKDKSKAQEELLRNTEKPNQKDRAELPAQNGRRGNTGTKSKVAKA